MSGSGSNITYFVVSKRTLAYLNISISETVIQSILKYKF